MPVTVILQVEIECDSCTNVAHIESLDPSWLKEMGWYIEAEELSNETFGVLCPTCHAKEGS